MIKNCFIWTRVSTKHQEENGGSLDDQKCRCEKYAKDNGYTIKGYFGGTHESAKTPGKLICICKEGTSLIRGAIKPIQHPRNTKKDILPGNRRYTQ